MCLDEKFIYGRTATPPQIPNAPERVRRTQVRIQHRESQRESSKPPAGRRRGRCSRQDGKSLKFAYQTSINALAKGAATSNRRARKRHRIELKSVVASVFFSSDAANPDTYTHFYCDAQMYNTTMTQPESAFFMTSTYPGRCRPRRTSGRAQYRPLVNKEYDDVYKQAERSSIRSSVPQCTSSSTIWLSPTLHPARVRRRSPGRARNLPCT